MCQLVFVGYAIGKEEGTGFFFLTYKPFESYFVQIRNKILSTDIQVCNLSAGKMLKMEVYLQYRLLKKCLVGSVHEKKIISLLYP